MNNHLRSKDLVAKGAEIEGEAGRREPHSVRLSGEFAGAFDIVLRGGLNEVKDNVRIEFSVVEDRILEKDEVIGPFAYISRR